MLRRLLYALPLLLLAASVAGAARAADTPQVVYLWPAGSPTLKGAGEKEITVPPDPRPGQPIRSVRNVHNPSIEVHLPPPDKATGCAIIVAPGGGHQQLVWATEGTEIADWLNSLGITAFILKYRLAQTPGYHYTVEGEALQDTQRAVRIVRARAHEWGVDPARVGILGFSAGGALAALADMRFDRGKAAASDLIDRESCRPDFVGLVYAGWAPMDITAPKDAAPAFLTSAGSDDPFHARETVEFYSSLFKAGVPAELHIYAHGGHGGGIHARNGIPFGTWHRRFEEWLADLGMLKRRVEQGALPCDMDGRQRRKPLVPQVGAKHSRATPSMHRDCYNANASPLQLARMQFGRTSVRSVTHTRGDANACFAAGLPV